MTEPCIFISIHDLSRKYYPKEYANLFSTAKAYSLRVGMPQAYICTLEIIFLRSELWSLPDQVNKHVIK